MRRREFLAFALGASAGAAACLRSPFRTGVPDGELAGAAQALGHRLRDAAVERPGPDRWSSADVVIVGGGIAGLAAARRLRKGGVDDLVLLELDDGLGGTSRAGSIAGIPCPWGAHYLVGPPASNLPLVALLDEMGLVEGKDADGDPLFAEEALCRDPEERVFYRGRWYEGLYLHPGASAADREELARFARLTDEWAGRRDGAGRRAFAIPAAESSDDASLGELDRISFAEWAREQRFSSPRLLWLLDYSCRDDYGLRADETSAWAGLFYFASRIPRPGVGSRPTLTWPEGNGRLVAHLRGFARGGARAGTAALSVDPVDGGVEIVTLSARGEVAGIRCRHAIVAAPQLVARRIVGPWRREAPRHAEAFSYGAWYVVNLHLSDRPAGAGFPLAWDNVLYDSAALGYVVATHQSGVDHGPTVLTWYMALAGRDPRAARDWLDAASREELAETALADLERAHPGIRGLSTRADVVKWGHAMVRPVPGLRFDPRRSEAARPLGRIHFAHSDLSGLALFEESFFHGTRAAEAVLVDWRRGAPRPTPDARPR